MARYKKLLTQCLQRLADKCSLSRVSSSGVVAHIFLPSKLFSSETFMNFKLLLSESYVYMFKSTMLLHSNYIIATIVLH